MTRHWQATPEQTLLLHAALDRGDSAAIAWRAWRAGGGDIQTLERHASRLLPLIAKNLAERGIDDRDAALLRGVRRYAWVEHAERVRRLMPHVSALVAGGVEVLYLKGVALAPLYYKELGLRMLADVDILVRRDAVPHALAILAARGVRPRDTFTLSLAPALVGEANLADEGFHHSMACHAEDGLELDLHWSVMYSNVGPHSDDAMWSRAVPFSVAGTAGRTLSTTDHLLHAIVHGLSFSDVSTIRWIADALAILRSSEPVDWCVFVDEVLARRVALPLREALDYLVAELAAPIPAWVRDRLARERPTLFARLRYAEMLRDWNAVRTPWTLIAGAARFVEGRPPLDALRVTTRYFRHRIVPRGAWYTATRIPRAITTLLSRPLYAMLHKRELA